MARIEPIPIRQWPTEMRDSLAAMTPPVPRYPMAPTQNRPKALNLLSTFAHHPALAKAFFTFNGHLLQATTLSQRQRELIVLRVGVRTECRYEWGQHLLVANDVGIDNDEIVRVESDPTSPLWSAIDSALLRAVDELIDHRAISGETWDVLSEALDPQQMLDLIYTVGAYTTLAWMINSVEVTLDDDLQALVDTHLTGDDGSL